MVDRCASNTGAADGIHDGCDVPIEVRQIKHLNNIIEQGHRSVKRISKPMRRFKSFQAFGAVLAGIELMRMMRRGQKNIEEGTKPFFRSIVSCAGGVSAPKRRTRSIILSEIRHGAADATEPTAQE